MESLNTYWSDRALLEWQIELGADEALNETPVNRYDLDPAPAKPVAKAAAEAPALPPKAPEVDVVAIAKSAASGAADLEALAAAMQGYEHCELQQGAKTFVFSDGAPTARVMIIGDAPGRQEDIAGKPFVGQVGVLLDKMFAAINLERAAADPAHGVYLTNVLPWRPPSNRTPNEAEFAMMVPFLERHITLANPDVVVLMGNDPCQALLGRAGITRLRGKWQEVLGRPALPMAHPSTLLQQPAAKRDAWADLLSLQAKLRELS